MTAEVLRCRWGHEEDNGGGKIKVGVVRQKWGSNREVGVAG